MAKNEVEIVVKVDAQGAITVLNNVGEEVATLKEKTDEGSGGFTRFQTTLITLNQTLDLVGRGFNLVVGSADKLFSAISRGSDVDDISSAFKSLADQAGAVSDVFLNDLQKATAGTISKFDLQKAAIEALRAGTKPDEFITLTKAARALADETGDSLPEAIDKLNQAFETGTTKIFKGVVGAEQLAKIQADLEKQIGATSGELDDQGKVLLTQQVLLEAAKIATQRVGEVSSDAGDNIAVLKSRLSDARDQIVAAISKNEDFNKTLQTLAERISQIDFNRLIGQLNDFLTKISNTSSAVVGAISTITTAAHRAGETLDGLIAMIPGVSKAKIDIDAAKAIDGVSKLAVGISSKLNPSVQDLDNRLNKIVDLLSEDTASATKSASAKFKELDSIITNLSSGELEQFKTSISDVNAQLVEAEKAFGLGASGTKMATEATKDAAIANRDYASSNKDAIASILDHIDSSEKLKKAKADELAFQKEFDEFIYNEGTVKLAELEKQAESTTDMFAGLATTIFSQLSAEFSTGTKGGAIGSGIGGMIGTELGGPGLGTAIGSLLGDQLGGAIESAFSSESAGTKSRKAADKFFAEAFDANRLGVIINDELVKVSDLVFQGNTLFGGNANFETGGVASFFESLPAVAREGFAGVGIAFEEMLGVGEDISGQLAAVFANNIGGSLNNLQLLVQSTGVSFEDLHGHVVEAFLDGKLSILETQSALSGIANIAQQGIPGAIGAVSEAFNNLKAAGTKGGRALVDALQDIGAESAELGLNTLPEVQAHLAKTGQFSAQEIQQVFTALQSNGINSVEALQNATVEQLLPALAQLETVEFPFAQAAKDINELIDQVNNIPKNITSNITFNVKTNVDSNSQQLINQGTVTVPTESGPGIAAT